MSIRVCASPPHWPFRRSSTQQIPRRAPTSHRARRRPGRVALHDGRASGPVPAAHEPRGPAEVPELHGLPHAVAPAVGAAPHGRPSFGSGRSESVGDGDGSNDPLAQLACAALLQVLHLTLNVHEIDSRWRMGQLLCRLLSRLSTSPLLIAPHVPSLAQWLPTAWAACGDEQLMQEATLDAAATMVDACSSPALQPPWQLIAAGLDLVARAGGWPAIIERLQRSFETPGSSGAGSEDECTP